MKLQKWAGGMIAWVTLWGLAGAGCGTATSTSDITSLLSSLTGMTITDSTTIGEILNQLTVGDIVSAYQQYASTQVSGHMPPSLTSDQISQLEDLQAQLDAGTIDQATFDTQVQSLIGDVLPHPGNGEGHFGGPFGLGVGGHRTDALNLTDEQKTAAQAIFTQLKTDIDTLRSTAQTQILALLTDAQKTTLETIGLNKIGHADRPMGGPGGMHGPGHHGSLGLGENTAGDTRYLDLLAKKLSLTDEQKASIQTILDTLRTDVTAAHDKANADFRALLTADQIAILDALKASAGS